MKKIFTLSALIVSMLITNSTKAQMEQNTVMVGGAAMYPTKNIVENALNSADHTTLVAAVKAAGLAGTLEGKGPFTVFAPTNEAFSKLPAGAIDNLLMPQNKSMLTSVLTYHVVAGNISSNALMEWIKKNGGTYTATTIEGGKLMFSMNGNNLVVMDESGNTANIVIKDVFQSNGVIHVIDKVLMPKS